MFITRLAKLFFSQSQMHPYLLEGLTKHNVLPLRPLQIKTFDIFDQGLNLIIKEMDGSGKTLGYLIPIINHILFKKEQKLPPSTIIILTLNKELVLQIYQQIRKIDFKNQLTVIRSGSITHYSAIIEQMCKPKQLQDQDLIDNLIDKNVADSVIWSKTDILISTPQTLYRIMARKIQDKEKIYPQLLVIDEGNDILGSGSQLKNYSQKVIQYLQKFIPKQRKLRYIISSLRLRDDNKIINSLGFFSNLSQCQPFSRIEYCTPTSIIEYLSISFIKIHELSKDQILEEKMENLFKCLQKRMAKKLIIYCLSSNVQKIKKKLKIKLNMETLQYYARLSSEKRISVLEEFNQQKNNIMVATQLAAKGLNFKVSIDAIISFDMNEDIWEQVSRICRSNTIGAQYIMMSTEDDSETLVNLISAKLEGDASKYLQKTTIKELKFVNGTEMRV